jgi:hypothetical protein
MILISLSSEEVPLGKGDLGGFCVVDPKKLVTHLKHTAFVRSILGIV